MKARSGGVAGEAVEDVGLGDEERVETPVAQDADHDDRTTDDDVDSTLLEPGIVPPLACGLGREGPEDLLGGGSAQPEVVDEIAPRGIDAELDGSQRPNRAGRAHERRRPPGGRQRAPDIGQLVAHDRDGLAQLLGRRRVGMEELLGQPDATDVDRTQVLGLVDLRAVL